MVQKLIKKSVARQKIIEAITGRKKPFTSIDLHYETKLPFDKINKIIDELEKEGKVKEHE
ncbi:MAG TPA: hypothetical protein VJB90_00325 [Candidatus Nanoarchaeia archaeon]|nr:hypothetical protein [Candidatus Nanoarchaeia archaeon]